MISRVTSWGWIVNQKQDAEDQRLCGVWSQPAHLWQSSCTQDNNGKRVKVLKTPRTRKLTARLNLLKCQRSLIKGLPEQNLKKEDTTRHALFLDCGCRDSASSCYSCDVYTQVNCPLELRATISRLLLDCLHAIAMKKYIFPIHGFIFYSFRNLKSLKSQKIQWKFPEINNSQLFDYMLFCSALWNLTSWCSVSPRIWVNSSSSISRLHLQLTH